MKQNKKILIILTITILILTSCSNNNQNEQPPEPTTTITNSGVTTNIETIPTTTQAVETIQSNILANIMMLSEDVYLEALDSSTNIIAIPTKSIEEISQLFNNLEIEKNEELEEVIYTYAIFIPERNIKLFIGTDKILIEEGFKLVKYNCNIAKLEELKEILKKLYISAIDEYIRSIELTKFIIEAKDEDKLWNMEKDEAIFLLEYLELIDIISNESMVNVPVEYPDYRVYLESDSKNAILEIINEEIIKINIFNEKTYFKYKNEFRSWISVLNEYDSETKLTTFTRLLTSEKVFIESIGERKDIEGEAFYSIELARVLNNADKTIVEEVSETDNLKYEMTFEIQNRKQKVDIYNDHIIIDKTIYFSEGISEKIYTILLTI